MENEYGSLRNQLKGYLFEIVIMELLIKNQFSEINVPSEANDRVRESRQGFIEFKGRGCWHQIDCPCDYIKQIPFSYPLRLLGEVKFHRYPIEKKYIREYIGIIKDIQENYFVSDELNFQNFHMRKMEIGVFFSASGFQKEAEKIAYAHGIKTISYKNNYLINRIKNLIDELEKNYLSVKCLKDNSFRREFKDAIRFGYHISKYPYFSDGYNEIINNISFYIQNIRASFIATTATGVFLHFVGENDFPCELFLQTDRGRCRIFYEYDNFNNRFFWIEISGDNQRRRFYFTPPESLNQAAVFGNEIVLNEKERLFKTLSVNINLNGLSRNLILNLDEDWIDAVRREF